MRRLAGALLWVVLLSVSVFAEPGYVDSAVCATCHAREAETYRKTAMARAFSRPTPDGNQGTYYHKASDTYYAMTARDGRVYQSQYQLDFDGKQTNFAEKVVDYVVGSGNHTRTYLSRTGQNALIELPLAWYAEKGGYWAMNPGYDRPDQDGFRRHIEYNCMFCHNAYPDLAGVSKAFTGSAVFPAQLPEGIDCQRCHGPGQAHVEAKGRAPIVNPAKLAPARQAEVCQQCHLETTSFPLPNSLTRFEREPFSYRPGEPLNDFKLFFDHAPKTGHDDDFEIASSAYRLSQSQCVSKSAAGKLTCTTCHDPHAAEKVSYNAVCGTCHAGKSHFSSGDCVSCHMQKRRTDEVVHVVMTDHRIQRPKEGRDLLAEKAERNDVYRGEVVPYRAITKPDDELYVAAAQVVESSNLAAGIPRLYAALRKFPQFSPEPYVALADALRTAGQCRAALPVYESAERKSHGAPPVMQKMALCFAATGQFAKVEEALQDKAPDNAKVWTQLGLALAAEGKVAEGVAALQKATAVDPDLSEAWNDLGGIWMQTGDNKRAEPALRAALRVQPNYAEAHSNLANLLSGTNRFEEAKFHFEAALRYKPDYAFARYGYGIALARVNRLAEAKAQLESSLRIDQTAAAHQGLGMVLAAQGEPLRAIAEYREAIRIRPEFDRANLSLGAALIEVGKASEAAYYLKRAAQSKDPAVRVEAIRLLQ